MSLCLRSVFLFPACRTAGSRQYHHFRNVQTWRFPRLGARVVLAAGIVTTTTFAFSMLGPGDVHADASEGNSGEGSTIRSLPFTSLLRSYFVYSVCSVPVFVDWSQYIISFMTSVPGLKQLAGALIRRSFFAQVRIYLTGYHGR